MKKKNMEMHINYDWPRISQTYARYCSMFKSNDVREVNDIINETVNNPDKVKANRSDSNRIVYIKKI